MYDTSCEKCTFAKYENKIQIGCELGRIEKFKEQGKVSLPTLNKDATVSYFIINGLCITCRDNDVEWNNGLTMEQKKEKVLKEVEARTSCIILSDNHNIDDIKTTLLSAEKQKLKFTKFHIVVPPGPQAPKVVLEVFRTYKNREDIKVTVSLDKYDYGKYVDEAVKVLDKKDCVFYLVCKAGTLLDETINDEINHTTNIELIPFFHLQGPNFEVVHRVIHESVGGHRMATHENDDGTVIQCDSVKSKIEVLCKDSKQERMMVKWV